MPEDPFQFRIFCGSLSNGTAADTDPLDPTAVCFQPDLVPPSDHQPFGAENQKPAGSRRGLHSPCPQPGTRHSAQWWYCRGTSCLGTVVGSLLPWDTYTAYTETLLTCELLQEITCAVCGWNQKPKVIVEEGWFTLEDEKSYSFITSNTEIDGQREGWMDRREAEKTYR